MQYFLRELGRVLTALGHQQAQWMTLKAFRAGKASQMAVDGRGIADILAAEEWRSSAWLKYVDMNMVEDAASPHNATAHVSLCACAWAIEHEDWFL